MANFFVVTTYAPSDSPKARSARIPLLLHMLSPLLAISDKRTPGLRPVTASTLQ